MNVYRNGDEVIYSPKRCREREGSISVKMMMLIVILAGLAIGLFVYGAEEAGNPQGETYTPPNAVKSFIERPDTPDPKMPTEEPATPVLTPPRAKAAAVNDQLGTIRDVTAYTSRPEETDSTPCISADGSDICQRYAAGEGICAANFVPLGTRLAIEGFGECTVADRMNSRYQNRVDLYHGMDLAGARHFGTQRLNVSIIQ